MTKHRFTRTKETTTPIRIEWLNSWHLYAPKIAQGRSNEGCNIGRYKVKGVQGTGIYNAREHLEAQGAG